MCEWLKMLNAIVRLLYYLKKNYGANFNFKT